MTELKEKGSALWKPDEQKKHDSPRVSRAGADSLSLSVGTSIFLPDCREPSVSQAGEASPVCAWARVSELSLPLRQLNIKITMLSSLILSHYYWSQFEAPRRILTVKQWRCGGAFRQTWHSHSGLLTLQYLGVGVGLRTLLQFVENKLMFSFLSNP